MFSSVLLALHIICAVWHSSADSVAGPAVFNGEEWVSVVEDAGNDPSSTAGFRPVPPLGTDADTSHLDIFVGILQYRDPRCGQTLRNLFTKAAHPDRIHVGMVQQRSTEDTECLRDYCNLFGVSPASGKCPHLSQVKIVNTNQFDAKSFSRGRALVQTLRSDETFCMSIEVSTDFIKDWDDELIRMWHSAGNEYAILSTYPPITKTTLDDVVAYSTANNNEVPHLCQAAYYSTAGTTGIVPGSLEAYSEANGIIENLIPRPAVHLTRPLMTTLYSSAFAFGKCHAEAKAPWDPFFENIDKGDDFHKFARLWTRGYDVYTPNKVVVVIDSSRIPTLVGGKEAGVTQKDRFDPVGWLKNGMTPQVRLRHREDSMTRHNIVLGSRKHFWDALENKYGGSGSASTDDILRLTRFGLGSKRTLDQLIAFTGIDTRNRLVVENKCGKRTASTWVPYKPDMHAECEDGDAWGMAPEVLLPPRLAVGGAATRSDGATAAYARLSTWSGISPGSAEADLFHFVFYGNTLPFTNKGSKQRLSARSGSGAVAVPQKQQQLPDPAVVTGQQAGHVAVPTAFAQIWSRLFGWWVDDWVSLTEQLIATQISEDAAKNSIRITQLMLITFPILLCVVTALVYPICAGDEDGDEWADGDEDEEDDYYDGDGEYEGSSAEEQDDEEVGGRERDNRNKTDARAERGSGHGSARKVMTPGSTKKTAGTSGARSGAGTPYTTPRRSSSSSSTSAGGGSARRGTKTK